MIQRIQTVYIALAVIIAAACLCIQVVEYHLHGASLAMHAVLLLSVAVGTYSIFVYTNRMRQARMCVFNTLLMVGWYVVYFAYVHLTAAEVSFSAIFPIVSAILYILARKGIIHDESLVRAADRIR